MILLFGRIHATTWSCRSAELSASCPIETGAYLLVEIRYGLAQLTPGKRRKALEDAFSALLHDDMEDRVLSFDASAAEHAARLSGERRRTGSPVDMRDKQIAGI